MSASNHRRPPLSDTTTRVNNSRVVIQPTSSGKPPRATVHNGGVLHEDQHPYDTATDTDSLQNHKVIIDSPRVNAPHPRLSEISKSDEASKSKRNSQISNTSINCSDGRRRRKTHIGPWHLGKTLGKGATARVRMAKHAVTGQPAAVKIVQKKNALMSQAGSLAALNRKDVKLKDGGEDRRMPYGIEREVAIMKLIEHPHIMQLYDIWENRTEIYLVLEYVGNGELFDHISRNGHLSEKEAMKYFRQLLSAVGYCHQFNICHRDLKPENILLTSEHNIKIADFGMAALQQTPDHRLVTSCGSPHYAAPEVIQAVPYKGNKVDIWSMGVILFATLAGRLPFDNPSLKRLLASIQKGTYQMASTIGTDAADLIQRMLQVDPRDRISINQIWRHPLLKKYEYLDNYRGGINPTSIDPQSYIRPMNNVGDIDKEILRHLKSLWHQFEEKQLVNLLLSDNANDQKLFYGLLLKHREYQLENYTPDIGYSKSDYHHVRPLAQVKKLSTRQFSQGGTNGYKRQISRFTVVSNTGESHHVRKGSGYADTESGETVKSYDPFRESRPQHLAQNGKVTQANVVVHRTVVSRIQEEKQISRNGGSSASSKRSGRHITLNPPRAYVSRSSLASSTRSRNSNQRGRVGYGYRRGVSFNHSRHPSTRNVVDGEANERIRQRSNLMKEVLPAENHVQDSPDIRTQVRSRKEVIDAVQTLPHAQKRGGAIHMFQDDVRQLSTSLAKDCDEAFNKVHDLPTASSSVGDCSDNPYAAPFYSFELRDKITDPSLPSFSQPQRLEASNISSSHPRYCSRPLPVPPKRTESVEEELARARRAAQSRRDIGDVTLDRMVSHIDRLMLPNQTYHCDKERRAASAPNPPTATGRTIEGGRPLPVPQNFSRKRALDRTDEYVQNLRQERTNNEASHRNRSALEACMANRNLNEQEPDYQIPTRPVQVFLSPPRYPAPLNIRKVKPQPSQSKMQPPQPPSQPPQSLEKSMMTGALIESKEPFRTVDCVVPNPIAAMNGQYSGHSDDPYKYDGVDDTSKKKMNWFKRNLKTNEERNTVGDSEDRVSDAPGPRAIDSKRKNFGLGNLFKKRSLKDGEGRALGSFHLFDDNMDSIADNMSHYQPTQANYLDNSSRQIEPQQNWLARLFHVKPAKGYLCFNLTKRRARQEVTLLLKDWRQYGIKDIVVNKERNIVFGKVGERNYLHLKEVAFACEIMTVIEHGKKGPLSIARFTQESGAASSFHKVVDTVQDVFNTRGLLVGDERKRRMMIKTLTSA